MCTCAKTKSPFLFFCGLSRFVYTLLLSPFTDCILIIYPLNCYTWYCAIPPKYKYHLKSIPCGVSFCIISSKRVYV